MIYTKEQMDEIKEMPSILKLLNPYIQKLPQYRNILEELLGLQIRKERLD